MKLFCVQDMVAGTFLPPFVDVTEGVAVRRLRDVMARGDHAFSSHPADYCLYEIGSFDEVSGAVAPISLRRVLVLSSLVETVNG